MKKYYRWILLLLIYGGVIGGGWLAGQWLPTIVDINISPRSEPLVHQAVMATMVLFVFASALPFVPGAEIGFGLIMLFGGKIALLIYFGMIMALILAFITGQYLPLFIVANFFRKIGFKRAHEFILKLASLNPQERQSLLSENTPRRFIPFMLRHRYVALILILNLPGNSIVGGGGGISFMAGLSGLYSYFGFLAAISIAVAPVPIFFFLTR